MSNIKQFKALFLTRRWLAWTKWEKFWMSFYWLSDGLTWIWQVDCRFFSDICQNPLQLKQNKPPASVRDKSLLHAITTTESIQNVAVSFLDQSSVWHTNSSNKVQRLLSFVRSVSERLLTLALRHCSLVNRGALSGDCVCTSSKASQGHFKFQHFS